MRRNISRAFLALAFAGGLAAIGTATPSLAQVYFDGASRSALGTPGIAITITTTGAPTIAPGVVTIGIATEA